MDVDAGVGKLLEILRGRAGAVVPLHEERLTLRAPRQTEPLDRLGQSVRIVRDEIDLRRAGAVREGGERQQIHTGALDGGEDPLALAGFVGEMDVEVVDTTDLVGHEGPS